MNGEEDLKKAREAAEKIKAGIDPADGGYNDYNHPATAMAKSLHQRLQSSNKKVVNQAKVELSDLTEKYGQGSGTSGMVITRLEALNEQDLS